MTKPWPDPTDALTTTGIPKHCGLGRLDKEIWQAHIIAGSITFDRAWFNLVVGTLPTWAPTLTDTSTRNWVETAYCKRPDVIWESDGELWLAEIKPYASYCALGQTLLYGACARNKLSPHRDLRLAIITDQADPDLLEVTALDDITLFELDKPIGPRPHGPT